MSHPIFHSFQNVNWERVLVGLTAAAVFWGGLQEILPAEWLKYGTVVLGALTLAVGVFIRGGKPPEVKP